MKNGLSFNLKDNMLSTINRRGVRIHFIGIGGSGMCGIAEVLRNKGCCITGSDIVRNDIIKHLSKLGVKVFFGHRRENIGQADVIVISSAVSKDNPEIQAARYANIPVMKRAEMLSVLMQDKYGIAVSGTHGKTTTTAMIANIYIDAGLDPTFINGGILKSEMTSARLGGSRYVIAEADESDKSFLYLFPKVEVITNIDTDHMSTYCGNFEYLKRVFIKFIHNLPYHGYVVVCVDDITIREILPKINRKIITYGFSPGASLQITKYYQNIEKSSFTIFLKNNKKLLVSLNMPGRHNALNATAAIAVAIEDGINDSNILKTMLNFQGAHRRFENLGNYLLTHINGRSGKIMLIDDYGHHPTELNVTIETIRVGWPNKRLIMIFQPHRFTRVQELYNDFINVLSNVDLLIVLNVFSSGESPILGADSQSLCNSLQKKGKINPIFISNLRTLFKTLAQFLRDNDLILIQGAGTIGKVVRGLFCKTAK